MKPTMLPLLAAVLLITGCTTPRDPMVIRQQKMEARLGRHLAVQNILSNRAERLHTDLLARAQELRELKEEANALSIAVQTNRLAIEALAGDLPGLRQAVLEAEKRIAEEAARTRQLEEALAAERRARDQEVAATRAAAEQQAREEREKAAALKAALDNEKAARQQQEKEQAAARRSPPPPAAKPPAIEPAAAASPAQRLAAEAQAALNRKDIKTAEKLYKEALAASPSLLSARVGLAACRYEQGDLDEAGRYVTAVLKEEPRHAQALGLRGLLHWRKGELAEAEEVLTRAVKERTADSQLQNYLGIVLFERRKSDAAIDALQRAVQIDPANAEAHYNLSVVLATGAKPDLKAAATSYAKALELGTAPDPAMEKLLKPAPDAPKAK